MFRALWLLALLSGCFYVSKEDLELALGECEGELATWYVDADGDGYGDPALSVEAASEPDGYVSDATDCDDGDAGVNPGAVETCNEIDDDCDGVSDDGVASTWYADADGDGYGGDDSAVQSCEQPADTISQGGDCDDADPDYNPAAREEDCDDPEDYNCDGSVGYEDADGDGFAACKECNDASASISPDADETCDALDNDCDGTIDEDDAIDASAWYGDADADLYGDAGRERMACEAPDAYVADSTDCDDTDGDVHPGATEGVGDELDQDCDGQERCYTDADMDGYAAEAGTITPSSDTDCQDGGEADDAAPPGDCDDDDGDLHPEAEDSVCDEIDRDCNGHDGDLAVDDDGGTYAGAYETVQDAILDATGGELVCVAPGTYSENITITDKEIQLVALACDGGVPSSEDCREDTVLDGDVDGDGVGDGRVVDFNDEADAGLITSASRLSGFTLQNGASTTGAGLRLLYASPLLEQLIITGNTASGASDVSGGGLWAQGADLWMSDVELTGNAANSDTSEFAALGGGLYLYDSSATLRGVTLSGNTVTSPGNAQGGAIYATFVGAGGAIALTETTLSDNGAVSTGQPAQGGGLFLYNVSAGAVTATLTDVDVTGNEASATDESSMGRPEAKGGGVAVFAADLVWQGTADDPSVLSENTASSDHLYAYGGGLYAYGGTLQLTHLDVRENRATAADVNDFVVGGGIYVVSSVSFEAAAVDLASNQASGLNPAGDVGGGAYLSDIGVGNWTESAITGNDGDVGGGLYLDELGAADAAFELQGLDISTNVADEGGGLFVSTSYLDLTGVDFGTNSATSAGGGMLQSDTGEYRLEDCTFTANSTANYGGAGAQFNYDDGGGDPLTITMTEVSFEGNTAACPVSDASGGVGLRIYDLGGTTRLTLDTVDFTSNVASVLEGASSGCTGGGMMFVGDALSMDQVSFTGHETANKNGAGAAAAYIVANSVTASGLTVEDNRSSNGTGGGGVYIGEATTVDINDATFSGNEGIWGALCLNGTSAGGTQTATLDHVRFLSNHGDGMGGALYIADSGGDADIDVTMSNAVLADNTCDDDGGAVLLSEGGSLELVNATLVGNATSSGDGGAIYVATSADGLVVKSSTFAENEASGYGGATRVLLAGGGSFTYTHGYANTDSTGTVHFYGSTVEDGEDGNLLDVDPLYTDISSDDPADWDLTLQATPTPSPLTDAGDPDSVYDDPDGSTCDIGAYGGPGANGWDVDGDGFSGGFSDAGGLSASEWDCDDLDDSVYPGAADTADDGVDADCDGSD